MSKHKPNDRAVVFPPKSSEIPLYISTSSRHVDIKVSEAYIAKWRQLRADLVNGDSRLRDGSPVVTNYDVLYWILEQLDSSKPPPQT